MPLEQIVIIGLAAWRIAYLIVSEGGPRDLMKRVRERLGWPVLQCVYCLSVWIAVGLYVAREYLWPVIAVAAVAAVAAMIQKWLGFDYQ